MTHDVCPTSPAGTHKGGPRRHPPALPREHSQGPEKEGQDGIVRRVETCLWRSQRVHTCLSPVRSCLWRGPRSLLRAGLRAGGALRLLGWTGAARDKSHDDDHAPHRRLPRPSSSRASSSWSVVIFVVLYRRRRSRPSLSSSSVVVVHRRRPTTTFPTAPCTSSVPAMGHSEGDGGDIGDIDDVDDIRQD